MKKFLFALVLLVTVTLIWFLPRCGRMLVVNRPEKADVIVVLGGDINDARYWRGIQLLRDSYGQQLLLDAAADVTRYGQTCAESAAQFVNRSAGNLAPRVHVCPFRGDSTVEETKYVAACLEKLHANSALLVTSEYHTRRALSIFRRRLPQYRWSVAAANDAYFYGDTWWKNREWAKTTVMEWQKLIWWTLLER